MGFLALTVVFAGPSLGCLGDIGFGASGPGGSSSDEPGAPGARPGTGSSTSPGSTPGTGPVGTPDPTVTPPERTMSQACTGGIRPGPAPIRRLTRFEYNNTVRDLLGDTTTPATDFPVEERKFGIDNNAAALTVSPTLSESYLMAAERLAGAALDRPGAIALNPTCDLTRDDATCAQRLFAQFGERAYRRPLTPDEVKVLQDVYNLGKTSGGAKNGAKLALMTMLLSPRFLYRVEFGVAPKAGEQVVRLDSWEMASRLSYLIWGSMPDDALFAAARAGQLSTDEQIAAQVDRMLKDPKKSRAVARNFHEQWLELWKLADVEKDPKVFPTFSRSILGLMKDETQRFIDYVIFEAAEGTLSALMTAPYTFADATLAKYYDPRSTMTGTTMQQLMLDPKKRGGMLTQGSLMTLLANANQSSPVLRGKFVREQMLCQELAAPPNDVQIELPPLSATLTTRERFEKHRTAPNCAACHTLLDPIGLGFENLNGVGVWRDTENSKTIDASGEVVGLADGKFVGAVELAKKLAASEELKSCVVEQWFTYGYGRATVEGEDACSLDVLKRRFAGGGMKIRDLLLALTKTDAFLYRRVGGVQ